MDWIIPIIIDGKNLKVDLNGDNAMPASGSLRDVLSDRQAKAAARQLAEVASASEAQSSADQDVERAQAAADAAGLTDASNAENPTTIPDAIKARHLIEGMTIEEACRAARAHPRLLKSRGTERTYRWEIHARIGEHTVWSRDAFGNEHTDIVVDYGIADSVDATFTDGRLSSIDKGGDFSTTVTKQEELWREGDGLLPPCRAATPRQ